MRRAAARGSSGGGGKMGGMGGGGGSDEDLPANPRKAKCKHAHGASIHGMHTAAAPRAGSAAAIDAKTAGANVVRRGSKRGASARQLQLISAISAEGPDWQAWYLKEVAKDKQHASENKLRGGKKLWRVLKVRMRLAVSEISSAVPLSPLRVHVFVVGILANSRRGTRKILHSSGSTRDKRGCKECALNRGRAAAVPVNTGRDEDHARRDQEAGRPPDIRDRRALRAADAGHPNPQQNQMQTIPSMNGPDHLGLR